MNSIKQYLIDILKNKNNMRINEYCLTKEIVFNSSQYTRAPKYTVKYEYGVRNLKKTTNSQIVHSNEVYKIELDNPVFYRKDNDRFIQLEKNKVCMFDLKNKNEFIIKNSANTFKRIKQYDYIEGISLILGFHFPIFNNIGHFMVDQAPIVWLCHRLINVQYDNIVIFGVQNKVLKKNIIDLLNIVLYKKNVNIIFKSFSPIRCEKSIIINGLTVHPNVKHPIIKEFFGTLRVNEPGEYATKVFISRADANDRFLLNEDDINEQLTKKGFKKMLGTEMTISEARRLLNSSKIIVGVCGATLSHIVFCNPGTVVVNILPMNMSAGWYYDLASLLELKYYEIRGEILNNATNTNRPRISNDFSIDSEDVTFILNSLEDTSKMQ
jgi:hypothetical protein